MSSESEAIVVPGQRLGTTDSMVAGAGTYARGQYIIASVVGKKHVVGDKSGEGSEGGGVGVITVSRSARASTVPAVGNVVTGTVTLLFDFDFFL